MVRGVVFNDLNQDGLRQVDEPGIAGVLVRATTQTGSNQGQYWETRTVASGNYTRFLPAGDYLARQTNLPFWLSTTPDEAPFALTEDGQVIQIDFGDRAALLVWLPLLIVEP